jgi:hypothetical protein
MRSFGSTILISIAKSKERKKIVSSRPDAPGIQRRLEGLAADLVCTVPADGISTLACIASSSRWSVSRCSSA